MRCRAVLVLIPVAGLLARPGPAAQAAQQRLSARADTYVDAARPHRAYGRRASLRISSSPPRRAYVRFAVPRLGSRLTRATLLLAVARGAGRLTVRRVSGSWSERGTTYARTPRARGSAIRSRLLRRERVAIDVTRLVRVGRNLNVELSGGRDVLIRSRESTRPPILVVESAAAAPTPASPSPPPSPFPSSSSSPPAPAPVVAAAGDIACSPTDLSFNGGLGTPFACAQMPTSDLLMSGGLAAVLALGDLQYENGTLAEFQASFDPSWGRVKALIRPAAGNHEYNSTGAQGYFDYFDGIGALTGAAGSRGQGYYSFDLDSWHLIALNSNCAYVAGGGCEQGSAQEKWLAADLRAHPAACTLAFWHHPRWTSAAVGNDPTVSALWNDLQSAGADVVLTAHGHIYERFAPQGQTTPQQLSGTADPVHGMREFVVGTGGENHAGLGAVQANSEMRDTTTFGVLELTLRAGSYEWRFVPAAAGAFTDSGNASCH